MHIFPSFNTVIDLIFFSSQKFVQFPTFFYDVTVYDERCYRIRCYRYKNHNPYQSESKIKYDSLIPEEVPRT